MENTLLNQDLSEKRQEAFKIENLEGATWAFRKLRVIQEKKAELYLIAEQERARIDKWLDNEVKAYESDKEYFEVLLSAYYIYEKAEDKKFKLSTPYGKITSRKTSKWIYENEEELIKYLDKEDSNGVRIKKEIDKTYLKNKYKDGVNSDTGEILPFIRIEETETISVKAE